MRTSPPQGSSGMKSWARTQFFRVWTALATLLLLGLGFFYSPELLAWWLRITMRFIEFASSLVPYPWGDRIEIALKGFGGSFWFQIALAIILVRVAAWLIWKGLRSLFSRRKSRSTADSQTASGEGRDSTPV